MTRASWAERKVRTAIPYVSVLTDYEMYAQVAKILLAEHKRAVRAVNKLEKAAQLDQFSMGANSKGWYLKAIADMKAALQKGRT